VIGAVVKTARQTLALLDVQRGQLVTLLLLGGAVAALEGVGLGLLVPVLQYVERGPAAVDARVWRLVTSVPVPPLAALLLISCVPILARQVARYFQQTYTESVRLRAIGQLRTNAFAAIIEGELPFFVAESQGRLVSALTSQIANGSAALPYVVRVAEAVLLLAVYSVVLAFVAPWLLPLAAVGIFAVLLLVRARMKTSSSYGDRLSAAFEALHVAVEEKLSGIRLVKVRVQERRETEAHARLVGDLTSTLLALARQKELVEVAIEPVMMVGALAALYLAVTFFGMTLAGLGIVMFALLRMVPYVKQMTSSAQQLTALTASLSEVRSVIDSARHTHAMPGGSIKLLELKRRIVFNEVGFRYPDVTDRWALRNVTFTLERGTLTAIVGRSGSGKSTLLDLIARLRQPTEGEITFDDVPASAFEVASLRSAVGIVDQQGFLFNDTVAGNIAYGMPGVDPAAIREAARQAHAEEFIKTLPRGYDTFVGDRGVRLSAGQRQRLSLARVLLQDPDILLLDEPTSALDAESEEIVQAALAELVRTKVVVVVAHRLVTVRQATQILVLKDGQIVERGDHVSLLDHEGAYRRLFDLQAHV
jgi:ATP-binding cassette, subfamily B, bacterial MsbA